MSNYNKQISNQSNHGYSNICAYPEFFQYCLEHNLSMQEAAILNYILVNSKEWQISPSELGKKYGKDRARMSKALSSLEKKLNGDLVIPSRSKGTSGSLVNATEVYNKIYNKIQSSNYENKEVKEQESEEEYIPTEEELEIVKELEENINPILQIKYNNIIKDYPIKEKLIWLRNNQKIA